MSSVLFVHYPEFFSSEFRSKCDMLIRSEPALCMYPKRVDISTMPHYNRILQLIAPMRRRAAFRSYVLYAGLYLLVKMARPPSYASFQRGPLSSEDRVKARYHFGFVDECAAGVFVLSRSRKLAFNAFQNARRLFRQGKPVWVIEGLADNQRVIRRLAALPRSLRMSRQETFMCIAEFAGEPRSPIIEGLNWLRGKQ